MLLVLLLAWLPADTSSWYDCQLLLLLLVFCSIWLIPAEGQNDTQVGSNPYGVFSRVIGSWGGLIVVTIHSTRVSGAKARRKGNQRVNWGLHFDGVWYGVTHLAEKHATW